MSDPIDRLHERYTAETLRLPAVLLGVASAAIGFALHETSGRSWAWSLTPAIGAVLLWGLSFASGVLFFQNFTQGTKANIGLLEAKRIGYAQGEKTSNERIDATNKLASRYYGSQQWCLLAGALAYLVGHLWHIIDST